MTLPPPRQQLYTNKRALYKIKTTINHRLRLKKRRFFLPPPVFFWDKIHFCMWWYKVLVLPFGSFQCALLDTKIQDRRRKNESGKKCLKEIVFHVYANRALIQMTLNISFLFLEGWTNKERKGCWMTALLVWR